MEKFDVRGKHAEQRSQRCDVVVGREDLAMRTSVPEIYVEGSHVEEACSSACLDVLVALFEMTTIHILWGHLREDCSCYM